MQTVRVTLAQATFFWWHLSIIFDQIFLDQKFLDEKFFENFFYQIFFNHNFLRAQNFLDPKLTGPKFFLNIKYCWLIIFLVQIFFDINLFGLKFFGLNIFWTLLNPHFFWTERIFLTLLGLKILLWTKYLTYWPDIMLLNSNIVNATTKQKQDLSLKCSAWKGFVLVPSL